MGRSFFMGSAWDRHAQQIAEQGGIEQRGRIDNAIQSITDPRTGKTVKSRVRAVDSNSGLQDGDVNYKGDRVVKVGVERDGNGNFREYYQRYSDSGSSSGTYEVHWEKSAPGTHVIANTRRVRGI